MISNYLYTIGKYLSSSQRDEVLREIEANLYDYLEENFGEKEYTDAEIEKAIKAMGHPRKVAEAYTSGPRCLIGPAYIDTYWLIIKTTLVGIAIGMTVLNILQLPYAKDGLQLFIRLIAEILQSSLAAIGTITLIFAAVHHYRPQDSMVMDEQWSLSILEKAPAPDGKVKVSDLIFETFFICLGLILMTQPSLNIGIGTSDTVIIPIINMIYFSPFVVWIYLLLGSTLILNVYLLIKRQWQTPTRIASIILDICGVILFSQLVFTPEILDFSVVLGTLGNDLDDVVQGVRIGLNIGLAAAIIATGFEIFRHMRVLLKRKAA